jgi:hypothetical protein
VKGADVGLDGGLGGVEELSGREVGDELAVGEENDAMGEVESFVQIMRDQENGLVEASEEGAEEVLHLGG